MGDWLKRPLMLLDWYALGLGLVPLVYWVMRVSTRGDTLGLALRLGVGDRARWESWDCPLLRVIGPGELPLRRMALCGWLTYFCVVFCICAEVNAGWGASRRFTEESLYAGGGTAPALGGGCGVPSPWYLSADTRVAPGLPEVFKSANARAIGSRSFSPPWFDCDPRLPFLSGEATSKTLFPTLSWKLALGSTGSGLGALSLLGGAITAGGWACGCIWNWG